MILGKDVHPESKIYYWGAILIDVIRQHGEEELTFFSLYEKLRSDSDITIDLYTLTLDWLFLIGVIDSDDGAIQRCF